MKAELGLARGPAQMVGDHDLKDSLLTMSCGTGRRLYNCVLLACAVVSWWPLHMSLLAEPWEEEVTEPPTQQTYLYSWHRQDRALLCTGSRALLLLATPFPGCSRNNPGLLSCLTPLLCFLPQHLYNHLFFFLEPLFLLLFFMIITKLLLPHWKVTAIDASE